MESASAPAVATHTTTTQSNSGPPSSGISSIGSKVMDKITATEVHRINGYLRFLNIAGACVYSAVGIYGIFTPDSYSDFIVAVDILILGLLFIAFEFRQQRPSWSEKAQEHLGFLFTAPGRTILMLLMGLIVFSQGWFGIIVGIFYVCLAGFNCLIILKHPGYQANDTATTTGSDVPPQAVSYPSVAHVAV